ncbi:MAG: VWA domain-containing protein [Myxococcota bacterium]
MLEWMHPAWLLALPLALIPWLAWLRPHAVRFSALGAVTVRRTWRSLGAPILPLLECIAIVGVVVALARPQEVRRETLRESQGIDILLAIDTSGSMESPDMRAGPRELTRLEASKLVMAQFVSERPDDRIGLEVFGEDAFVQVPLTLDHEALGSFIGQLEIGMAGKNATAVGTAIAIGTKRMKELEAPSRVMILVTDGRSNAGSVSPLQAAEAAAALGVRVYTIGVGSAGRGGLFGAMVGAEIDERTLGAVATKTGGRYYRAADTNALAQVYAEIDQLEQSTARTKEFVHRDERYLLALLPALLAFFVQLGLSATVLRKLP